MSAEHPLVERLLTLARQHLGADVAWVSRIADGQQTILSTSGDAAAMHIEGGSVADAAGSYCVRVQAGLLPPVVTDARRDLVTRDLEITGRWGIGSYAGVPWRTPDGGSSGMLCCVSRRAAPELRDAALTYLAVIAGMLGDVLAGATPAPDEREGQVRGLLTGDSLRMVFQPAVRLSDGFPAAVEALARFDSAAFPTPDRAFAAAARFGLGVELEHLAVRRALARLPELGADTMMCVNLSAEALLDGRVQETLLAHADRHIGLELTEHTPVTDYLAVISVTERLRAAGVRIVVDDAGAGYASLNHILQLKPDIIKLDVGLVRGIDSDAARQALARSLVVFAGDIDAALVAEGIETPAELAMLRRLGVGYGQGFLLARPAALRAALASPVLRG
ncbi:EAL domain-containing protein [Actinoplanes sp. N902-109]|uniref:EAL domain-containing protein n=1 Tax=Actinoplanes sp. (strain N902-109) TaxID=649831 RepID=UPI0003296769|nr:EAL domain-containing protein [Actinoplanes sp. N902-109]AGL17755.1 PAS domain S-box/diguanylate cyclase (GGDEF) domain-containing protein [Actinoplanes sp. N902-109]